MLSVGKAQKLALARVFANNDFAKICILDEPSSSLDIESEQLFYHNLMKEYNDKIVLTISHKLSSTIFSDKIYFLENGCVLEEGNHSDLMKLNGRYAYVFNL